MKIVYQTATKIIADYIWEGQTPEAQVLQNVINSELGGSVGDYEVVDAPSLEEGYKYIINSDGSVGREALPETATRIRINELKAIGKDNWTDAQQKELIELLASQ
jgi:hypothetical protein|tara:strand:+ start:96 stop:410 length:315 start_codon:yes stop_codon:yes gene_type:complete